MKKKHRDMLQHTWKGLEKIPKNSTAYRTFLEIYLRRYKKESALEVTEISSVVLINLTFRKLKLN